MLSANDQEIQDLLRVWHESGRKAFETAYTNLNYDQTSSKTAKDRKKYIALDRGTGGVYLVDRNTGEVFTIRAYGVPNRCVGTLSDLFTFYCGRNLDDLATKRFR